MAMVLGYISFTLLLTFGHFPRSENREYTFHFMNNSGAVEVASMFTRMTTTPLLFMTKFLVKSLVYKGRTVIIKVPLVRLVMSKRELRGYLTQRAWQRLHSRSSLEGSLQISGRRGLALTPPPDTTAGVLDVQR